jgi:hypothetical protein
MQNQNSVRTRKSDLSAHQKEIRFLTGLSIFTSLLFAAGIFWLVNRSY